MAPLLAPTLLDALESGGVPWPGRLSAEGREALGALLAAMPGDARTPIVSAVLDPERNSWGRAALQTIHLLQARGATLGGLATDEVLEFTDLRGERFGAVPMGFVLPVHPGGDPRDVERMLSALDGAFAHRRYAVWIRRALPMNVDVEPIRRAVHLWLSALDRGERTEAHAVYEDDTIALDLTVLAGGGTRPGRVVTVMPLPSLDRLAHVDGRVVEAAARAEESLGGLPILTFAVADRTWLVSRGYLQQLLYGTPDRVSTTVDGGARTYEAEFTATGRSMFSDPACQRVARVFWLEPRGGPLDYAALGLENPWATHAPTLRQLGRNFVTRPESAGRKAVMRWEETA